MSQFDLPERIAHIIEREDSSDRHLQRTPCDKVGQLGDHGRTRGIRAARRHDPESLHGSEIRDGVDPVARHSNPAGEDWRPAVSEETLGDVLGGAGWDIESLEPATVPREVDGNEVEMAFWYVRAQRRALT